MTDNSTGAPASPSGSREPRPSGRGPAGFDPSRLALPATAGVCAFDRDECTVTLALDTADEVRTLLRALPPKNRVRLCD